MNNYLITNNEEYAKVAEKIYPVDLNKIYNNSENLTIEQDAETIYDKYNISSSWAVDKLPFRGFEKLVDVKKFNNIIRHFNLKH